MEFYFRQQGALSSNRRSDKNYSPKETKWRTNKKLLSVASHCIVIELAITN